ncbi:MAG: FprA family A-type flavoprotein [Christensenellales bacterium]|jgi:flavorubredoxin
MKTLELKKNLYYVGVHDRDLRVFDIIMLTQYGTTYGSYVLKGSEKTVLFETAKDGFLDEYLKSVREIVDIADIDYIVVSHTEPDHSGSIEALVKMNPDIKIVGTVPALTFLKHMVQAEFKSITVKDDDVLSLGDVSLRFFNLPNLHWPDTMLTYIEELSTLVTCDVFGAHYSSDAILRSQLTAEEEPRYLDAFKYYFDNIIAPFKRPFMTNALKKIDGLKIDMICTGHGPVLDTGIEETIASYVKWCEADAPFEKKTVVMPYVSAYGYTRRMAAEIERGLRDGGVDVIVHDLVDADKKQVMADIGRADGLLFGTPTFLGDALEPIWDLLIKMLPGVHGGKPAAAFGSYGWSGEAVAFITERLKQLKMKTVEGLRVRFKPFDGDIAAAYEFGKSFAAKVLGE